MMRKATHFNVRKNILQLVIAMLMIGAAGQIQAQDDCPPLTVFCQDLHTTFMPEACMVDVWAKDFISKINEPGPIDTAIFDISFDEDDLVMSQIFESMGGTSYEVEIWVTNKCNGDQTRCVVNLDIQDNTGDCPLRPCPFDPNPWCGYAVVTCSARGTGNGGRIIDTRKNSAAPRGDDWADPSTSGSAAVDFIDIPSFNLNQSGQIFGTALNRNTGDIYAAASDVYALDFQFAPSVGFPPPTCVGIGGSAGIYRTNFGNVNVFEPIIATRADYPAESVIIGDSFIPNSGNTVNCNPDSIVGDHGNGIGNIAFDNNSNHLFASNLEDGKIYSVFN